MQDEWHTSDSQKPTESYLPPRPPKSETLTMAKNLFGRKVTVKNTAKNKRNRKRININAVHKSLREYKQKQEEQLKVAEVVKAAPRRKPTEQYLQKLLSTLKV